MRPSSRIRSMLPSLPILDWGSRYTRDTLSSDLVAALIVTIMLIPQSLAYALLAGLPPEVGLYASVAPLLLSMPCWAPAGCSPWVRWPWCRS